MPDFNSGSASVGAGSALAGMNTNDLSCLIDGLLEQYLSLLDEYTNLRAELGTAQSSIQQHLARANFHADRGVRYGASFYTPRMQASRVCRVTTTTPESPTISVHPYPEKSPHEEVHDISTKTSSGTSPITSPENPQENSGDDGKEKEKENETGTGTGTGAEGKEKKNGKDKILDPIRMFGFSTPRELKEAQKGSIAMIEGIIPKLVDLDERMKGMEIEIRRARKYRAKAEARISEEVKP